MMQADTCSINQSGRHRLILELDAVGGSYACHDYDQLNAQLPKTQRRVNVVIVAFLPVRGRWSAACNVIVGGLSVAWKPTGKLFCIKCI